MRLPTGHPYWLSNSTLTWPRSQCCSGLLSEQNPSVLLIGKTRLVAFHCPPACIQQIANSLSPVGAIVTLAQSPGDDEGAAVFCKRMIVQSHLDCASWAPILRAGHGWGCDLLLALVRSHHLMMSALRALLGVATPEILSPPSVFDSSPAHSDLHMKNGNCCNNCAS